MLTFAETGGRGSGPMLTFADREEWGSKVGKKMLATFITAHGFQANLGGGRGRKRND